MYLYTWYMTNQTTGRRLAEFSRAVRESTLKRLRLVPPGKELEGGYLWVGSPVRRARELTDDERRYLEYAAAHYVKLKNRHAAR